ncbi:MAG: hypothetical protein IPM54_03045 [Polyangiaceae bacterium]|nr:hypothetical protein [Polyangiaceae bacterium]
MSPIGVVCFAAGLCVVGMVAGVAAAVMVQRRPSPRVAHPPNNIEIADSAPATSASAMPVSSVASPASSPPVDVVDPPAAEGKFVKTYQVRLDVPPIDVQFSSDESLFYVLAQDGTLRAHDVEAGAEKRRMKLPGRGKSLKSLPGSRLAVLGLPAELVVIDEAAWQAGRAESDILKRIGVRDVIDVAALGDPNVVIAATGQGGRVVRLSKDLSTIDAEFVSVPPVHTLVTLRVGDAERLVMLVSGRPPADSGAVIVCDPAIDPFCGSRAVWTAMTEPRASLRAGSNRSLLFDTATATVVDFSVGAERRVAPSGPQPIAAFPWVGDRAVVIGAAGEATVVSLGHRKVQATVALGGVPSAAVATPDRRVVIAALGGGPTGRGATTVVLAGEPLAVESSVDTGEGSHVLAMTAKGGLVAVGATGGRTVTLFQRK